MASKSAAGADPTLTRALATAAKPPVAAAVQFGHQNLSDCDAAFAADGFMDLVRLLHPEVPPYAGGPPALAGMLQRAAAEPATHIHTAPWQAALRALSGGAGAGPGGPAAAGLRRRVFELTRADKFQEAALAALTPLAASARYRIRRLDLLTRVRPEPVLGFLGFSTLAGGGSEKGDLRGGWRPVPSPLGVPLARRYSRPSPLKHPYVL